MRKGSFEDLLKGDLKAEFIRLLIDNSPVAYIILDDHFRIHYINENFMKLRKLDLENTLGRFCYDISNAGKRCKQCAVEQAIKTGQKAFIARKDTLHDGSVRFIDDYAIPLNKDESDGTHYILEIMVNRTEEMLARERRDAGYEETLSILAQLIEVKDNYTAAHSESVRGLAMKLAQAMNLSPKDVFDISIAASLHDIGKVGIPHSIINKPGKLTDEEFEAIKRHPAISFEMISDLSSFENIKNIVRHHHERFDGRGYPDGLAGEQISLGARITAVADTYDAITSTRSYRKGLSHEFAMEEIARVAGAQLDPEVVKVFLNMDFNGDGKVVPDICGEKLTVERVFATKNDKLIERIKPKDFRLVVDNDSLLKEIFENTPCGYVVMDTNHNVLFASKYFLEYMGLAEEDVLGKLCYDAAGVGGKPCRGCAIERAVRSGKVEFMRHEQPTNNGNKIFDIFGMPLANPEGAVEYIIEVIIDRTAEIELDRQREGDMKKLINLMTGLLEDQEQDLSGEYLSGEINALRVRLDELLGSMSAFNA